PDAARWSGGSQRGEEKSSCRRRQPESPAATHPKRSEKKTALRYPPNGLLGDPSLTKWAGNLKHNIVTRIGCALRSIRRETLRLCAQRLAFIHVSPRTL